MNKTFNTLNRETETLLEEHKRVEAYLNNTKYQIAVCEEKIDDFFIRWKAMNPDFIERHFLFLSRRIDDLRRDRDKLIFLLGELNRRIKSNEEKIWSIVDANAIPSLSIKQVI